MTEGTKGEGTEPQCTCWVIMRGDRARPYGWEGDEYEITPDPDCPIHGQKKRRHPLMEDPEDLPPPDD